MSMWGGGIKPPRHFAAPPNTMPPPTSADNKFAKGRKSELEALRQKGLAKLLNRHFTTVTKTISEERAAADAALRDLEARKANTTEFVESSGGLGMYENLYMDLQAKKDALKRKERETLLLYQRYVVKFQSTGVVAVPDSREMGIGSTPPTPSASCNHLNKYNPADAAATTNVPGIATQIESTLVKNSQSGSAVIPKGSNEVYGARETYQSRADKQEKLVYEHAMRTLEARGVDAKYDPGRARKDAAAAAAAALRTEFESTPAPVTTTDDDCDDDDDLSALTDVASIVMSVAEERLIDFLKTETMEIRVMMEEEEQTAAGSVSSRRSARSAKSTASRQSQATVAAEKAEEMVRQMEKILHQISPQEKEKQQQKELLGKIHEPYDYATGNPNENWVVLWDPNHLREYYHERNSGRVQWEKPPMYTASSDIDIVARGGGEDVLSHMVESSTLSAPTRRNSRRDVYRKKQRRRRNRRIVISLIVVIFCVSVAAFGYQRTKTDPTFAKKMRRSILEPFERGFDNMIGMERLQTLKHTLHQKILMFMPGGITEDQEKKIRQDAERKVLAEIERQEQEMKAKMAAEKKAEEVRLARLAKEEDERQAKEVARAKALREQKQRELMAAQQKEWEEQRRLALIRPWHCNLPLMYLLNSRCRRLASDNPMFDLRSLVNSMIQ